MGCVVNIKVKCNYCNKDTIKHHSEIEKQKNVYCSRKCFADFRRGRNWNNFVPWNKGKNSVYSKDTLEIMKQRKLGHKINSETRKKMSLKHIGDKTNLWRGGITGLSFIIRSSFENNEWRKSIFIRDNYICQKCFTRGGKLHAHHKNKKFSQIFLEFLQNYSQFSPLEDKETLAKLATTYRPFWDIDNGQTLCKDCHTNTDSYLNNRKNKYQIEHK